MRINLVLPAIAIALSLKLLRSEYGTNTIDGIKVTGFAKNNLFQTFDIPANKML